MKMIIFLAAFALSSVSMAATPCLVGGKLVRSCKYTPKLNDSKAVAEAFESIFICAVGSETYMTIRSIVPEYQSDSHFEEMEIFDFSSLLPKAKNYEFKSIGVKVSQRTTGTSYYVREGGVEFALHVATNIQSKTLPAKSVISPVGSDLKFSSYYKCK